MDTNDTILDVDTAIYDVKVKVRYMLEFSPLTTEERKQLKKIYAKLNSAYGILTSLTVEQLDKE